MGKGFSIDHDAVWARFRELSEERSPNRVEALTEERPFLTKSEARVVSMDIEQNSTPLRQGGAVVPFPARHIEGEAALLALASILLTPKRSAKALARCEKRMGRAFARLSASRLPHATMAAEQLRRACGSCGMCDRAAI